MYPEAILVVFVRFAFIDILEISTNIFVDDEVSIFLAPLFIRANVLSGAKLDIVVPGGGCNRDNFGSTGVYSGSSAVG